MKKSLHLYIIFSIIFFLNLFIDTPSFAKEKKSDKTKVEKTKTEKTKPGIVNPFKPEKCSSSNGDDEEECEDEEECDEEECEDEEADVEEDEDQDKSAKKGLDKNDKDKKAKDKDNKKKVKEEKEEDDEEEVDEEDYDEDEDDSKDEAKEIEIKNYDMFLDDVLSDGIYPSFILFAQMNKELAEEPLIHFYIEDKNAHVKVTVEPNQFMEQCISEHDMTEKDDEIYSPWIKWKRDALLNADKPGFINFSAVLEVNGVVKNRVNKTITYRSVNEAFLGMTDTKGEYIDFAALFSCYVNEDHPRIDKILNEIIDKDKKARKITFYGYQGESDKDVLNQMEWIWNYFASKGTRYSDITGSSNASEKIFAQYVRFFEQVIDNNQANCIDGTCMLASFYKRIGLDVSIILVPGHAFLAVSGQETNKKGEPKNIYYLETTMMGTKDMTFKDALKEAKREFKEAPKDETIEVNINACRAAGIMPIGR